MHGQLMNWIYYAIGYVFITSGVMKLITPSFKEMFANLGLPFPVITLYFIAIIELACGLLISSRMYIKQATSLSMIIMIGAILVAKLPTLENDGLLAFAFESRLDVVMLILLFVIWKHRVTGKE